MDVATILRDHWLICGTEYDVRVPSKFTLPPYNEVKMAITHNVCGETVELRDLSLFPTLSSIAEAFRYCPFCEMQSESIDQIWAH